MRYDIIIVGGGLVGGLLGRSLGLLGFSVAVVDQAPPPAEQTPDLRTTAVAASSKALLDQHGIWASIADQAEPIVTILTKDGAENTPQKTCITYESRTLPIPEPLGYMVSNFLLRESIYETAVATPGVTWMSRCQPTALETGAHHTVLHTSQGTLQAPLLVGADGKDSWVRSQLGIFCRRRSYDQIAMITVCSHPAEHLGVAVELFTPDGPLAVLPMRQQQSAIVWSVRSSIMEALKDASDEDVAEALNKLHKDHRGPLTIAAPRKYYPLGLTVPHCTIGLRTCLVGDAAHCLHPIAGQGVNVGFRDVAGLVETLSEARTLGLDIGSQQVLQTYRTKRRLDQATMALVTDGLVRLFGHPSWALSKIRQRSMQVVEHFPWLKQRMMRHAMGYTSTQNELLKPNASRI